MSATKNQGTNATSSSSSSGGYSKEDCEKLSNLLMYVRDLPDACQQYPNMVKKVQSKEMALINPMSGTNWSNVEAAKVQRRLTTTKKPLK